MYQQINKLLLITVSLASLLFMSFTATGDSLDSAEIKNLRFLSQAILQSRAQEKDKVKKEAKLEREKLKKIQDELQALEQQMRKILLSVDFSGNDLRTAKIEKTGSINPQNNVVEPQAKVIEKHDAHLVRKRLITAKFNTTLNRLKTNRMELEDELPKNWQFWKKRTVSDDRKQNIVNEILAVENELTSMSQAKNIDLQKLEKLRKRVQIRKPEIFTAEIDPTIQTITKHRH